MPGAGALLHDNRTNVSDQLSTTLVFWKTHPQLSRAVQTAGSTLLDPDTYPSCRRSWFHSWQRLQ